MVAATLLLVACGGSDAASNSGTVDAEPSVPEPTSTAPATSVPVTSGPTTSNEAPTTSESNSTSSTASSEVDTTVDAALGPDLNAGPALDSVESFLASWAAVAAGFPELSDLLPTITAAEIEEDTTVGVDVFVEQATPSTVIGGLADPDTGVVTALMGLSDPDSDDTVAMTEIIWVGAFGHDELETFSKLFPAEDLAALEIGDQLAEVHDGKSVVMNYVGGANPDDGLIVFTVGDEALLDVDPAHDTIANVVIGVLVRTS